MLSTSAGPELIQNGGLIFVTDLSIKNVFLPCELSSSQVFSFLSIPLADGKEWQLDYLILANNYNSNHYIKMKIG